MGARRAMKAMPAGLVLALALGTSANAQDARNANSGLDVRAGLARSDNASRVEGGNASDTIATVGANMRLDRAGSRLNYDVFGDFDWAKYLDNTYGSTFSGIFDGKGNFGIVPDRFIWGAQETVSQLVRNPTQAETPDNLQTVSYFTTGPRLNFRSGATGLNLSGDYSTVNTESHAGTRQDNASTRYSEGASLVRYLSDSTSLSLNGTHEDVQFDDSVANGDYESNVANVAYAASSARMQLALSAGYTQVRSLGRTSGSTSAAVNVTRRVTPSSTLSLRLSQQTADSVDLVRQNVADRGPILGDEQLVRTDPLTQRGAQVAWAFARSRNNFTFSADWLQERGRFSNALDRNVKIVRGAFSRRIQPVVTLDLRASYSKEDFETSNFSDKEFDGSAALAWQVGRKLSLALRYDYFDRSAQDHLSDFTENRIGITAAYQILGGNR